MARISLTPTVTTQKKQQAKAWLSAQLANTELAEHGVAIGWLKGGVAIYHNDQPKVIMDGYWNSQEITRTTAGGYTIISCGRYDPTHNHVAPAKPERLAILGGIIHAVGLWEELQAEYGAAMARVLLDNYQTCFLDMVEAPKPANLMAFSADKQQVALCYTDEPDVYYLSNGEPVKIDDSWHVVSAG